MKPEANPHTQQGMSTNRQIATSYSLRWRLLLGAAVGLVLSLLLTGWGLRSLFAQHIQAQLEAHLLLQLNQISGALRSGEDEDSAGAGAGNGNGNGNGAGVALAHLAVDARFSSPLSGLYWQVDAWPQQAQQAQIGLLRSRSLWDQRLELDPEGRSLWQSHPPAGFALLQLPPLQSGAGGELGGESGGALLAVSRHVHLPEENSPVLRVTVAADRQLLAEPLQRFTRLLLLSLGSLAVGLLAAALVQMQWVLRPLGRMQQALAGVRSGQAQQLDGAYPQELSALVQEFNHVLASNAQMVERARTQAGNLAHALHTPLAVLANAAAGAQDGSTSQRSPEHQALAALVQEQVGLARRHVDYHLAQARASAAVRATGLRCALAPVVQALLRTLARLYPAIDFAVEDIPQALAFKGEAEDLFEMLGNLLDNAGKWASSRVLLRCYCQQEQEEQSQQPYLHLVVEDDGPGIADAQQRQAIFERGQRLDEQRPGTGLGLHIVREMAAAYGGEVSAAASALGGLRVHLRLPAAGG